MFDAVRVSLSWMTVLPVGRDEIPDSALAGRAMTSLPVVGLVCGLLATAVAHGVLFLGGGALLSGILGVAAVLVLTRGMHVDALADTVDGLGSYAAPDRALEIMRSGSIGPMGAAALVMVLLAEVAALGALVESGAWAAPVAAFTLARCLPVVMLRRGVPAASPTGFGAMVAGSQTRGAVAGVGLVAVLCGIGLAGATGLGEVINAGGGAVVNGAVGDGGTANGGGVTPLGGWTALAGGLVGIALYTMAAMVTRHVVRRLGGINGDVLGGVIETGTAVALIVAVILL